MDLLEIQMDQDLFLQDRMDQIEHFTQQYSQRNQGARATGTLLIPVVVHVVYRTGSQNISDEQVLTQIRVLNEDFGRTNQDQDNTWPQATNTEIQFCLASIDPDGNPTNGITRTQTRKRTFSFSRDDVKFNSTGGKDAWPAGEYMNIWVCDLERGLLGYAQFPGGAASTDGIVVDYQYFGTIGTATAPFDLGRTCTHEVGHWLNLRHIWGDGPCGVDDFVGDTPESDAPNYACAKGHISCGTTDMVENYMDYSDDACMNLFTADQSTRMRALFASGGARESLLTSNGCGNTTGTTCNSPGGLSTTNIADQSATLNWGAIPGAADYRVQYREVGTATWISTTTLNTSLSIGGLQACTGYEWQVQTNCTEGSSSFSATVSFTTTGCGGGGTGTCAAPTNLNVVVSNRSAAVTWDPSPDAISYNVRVREVGANNWSTSNTTGTSITINGIKKNRTYEFEVQSVCDGTPATSEWVGITFGARQSGNRLTSSNDGLTLQPNPVSQTLTLSWTDLGDSPVQLTVVDVTGRMVYSDATVLPGVGGYRIQVSNWPAGIYLLTLQDDKGILVTERFVVAQ